MVLNDMLPFIDMSRRGVAWCQQKRSYW